MSTSTEALKKSRRPKPAFNLRAKVGNGWVNIGAMWPLRSGEEGYSLKLTSIPLQWDGRCVALVPLQNNDEESSEPVGEYAD